MGHRAGRVRLGTALQRPGVRDQGNRLSGRLQPDLPVQGPLSQGLLRQHGGELSLREEGALRGAELHACTLGLPEQRRLLWQHCQLSECRAQGGDLGDLQGCTLRGAVLHGLRVHSLRDCDLSHARLEEVDLRGTDLSGSSLYGASLVSCTLDGVQAQGVDLRGVTGLTPTQLQALSSAGARTQAPWQRRLPRPLQGRLAALALPLSGLLALLGVGTALCLPKAPGEPVVASSADWRPSLGAAAETQSQLQDFRSGIAAAHQSLRGRGGRSFPTLEEVQANHYDLDGDGPGQALGVLFPKGLPRNLLSPGEGSVLPYCNAAPDQLTLSEEDVDWHYCPETGRVLASAGHTDEPTLEW